MAHCPNALWAFTFRHPCLPSPMGKEGSKAKLLKISRKADRDAPCDQARMLDSVRTEVVSTDAYKWSNRVGARCTDHTRPQIHRCKTHKRTQTCIGASPQNPMLSLQRSLSTVCNDFKKAVLRIISSLRFFRERAYRQELRRHIQPSYSLR